MTRKLKTFESSHMWHLEGLQFSPLSSGLQFSASQKHGVSGSLPPHVSVEHWAGLKQSPEEHPLFPNGFTSDLYYAGLFHKLDLICGLTTCNPFLSFFLEGGVLELLVTSFCLPASRYCMTNNHRGTNGMQKARLAAISCALNGHLFLGVRAANAKSLHALSSLDCCLNRHTSTHLKHTAMHTGTR